MTAKLVGGDGAQPQAPTMTRRRFTASAAGAASLIAAPAVLRAQTASIIRIGHIQPLTGPSAAYGIRARDGAQMAVEEINAGGGWSDAKGIKFTFEMTVGDMANDPKQAITLFRQYATDPEVMVNLGPTNSVGFVPIVPVAGQIKLPLIGNGSGAPIKEWNTYAYRVNPIGAVAAPALLMKVVEREKVKRLAVIYDQTQDAQAGDADQCRLNEKALGYEIVAYEAFRANDQDFSPQISKIRSLKPDAIYVAAATGDGIKGDYTWLAQDLSSPTAQLKTFLDKYNAKFTQQEATSFSTFGYDSVFTLLEALKKAKVSDRDGLAAALQTLDFTSPIGSRITFKNPPDGNNVNPSVVVVKVQGRGTYDAV